MVTASYNLWGAVVQMVFLMWSSVSKGYLTLKGSWSPLECESRDNEWSITINLSKLRSKKCANELVIFDDFFLVDPKSIDHRLYRSGNRARSVCICMHKHIYKHLCSFFASNSSWRPNFWIHIWAWRYDQHCRLLDSNHGRVVEHVYNK